MTVAVASAHSRGPERRLGGLPAGSLGMFSLSSEHIECAGGCREAWAAHTRQKRASHCAQLLPLPAALQSMNLLWHNGSNRRPWEPNLSS